MEEKIKILIAKREDLATDIIKKQSEFYQVELEIIKLKSIIENGRKL